LPQEKKRKKVKPKKTLTKGTMLNIVEIMRRKTLEIKNKIKYKIVYTVLPKHKGIVHLLCLS
jgi:hypothetical protein